MILRKLDARRTRQRHEYLKRAEQKIDHYVGCGGFDLASLKLRKVKERYPDIDITEMGQHITNAHREYVENEVRRWNEIIPTLKMLENIDDDGMFSNPQPFQKMFEVLYGGDDVLSREGIDVNSALLRAENLIRKNCPLVWAEIEYEDRVGFFANLAHRLDEARGFERGADYERAAERYSHCHRWPDVKRCMDKQYERVKDHAGRVDNRVEQNISIRDSIISRSEFNPPVEKYVDVIA